MKTIGIIGCGNMGSAIAFALGRDSSWKVLLYDIRTEATQQIAANSTATAVSLQDLLQQSDIAILAVKPQVIGELYPTLKSYSATCNWISLMAGVSLPTLEQQLQSDQIVRIQPNIAASVAKSVTAVVPHPRATGAFVDDVYSIVNLFGTAFTLQEHQMGAFTGVSASAIAACLSFLHGIAMGGVQQGLSYQIALQLIRDTTESAASIVKESGKHPVELLTNVCSPGGTTIEMMNVLEQGAFQGLLMEAVKATTDKVKLLDELAAQNVQKG